MVVGIVRAAAKIVVFVAPALLASSFTCAADDVPPSVGLPQVNVVEPCVAADAPNAIEVIDAAAVANAQLHELQQLQDQVANLRIASEGGRASPWFVSLRGFVNPFGAPQSAVAVYVDGVPLNDFYSFDQRLFDVERIEVRKGPQGDRYGANSEAGVIDIFTRRPDATMRAATTVALESRNGYGFDGTLSGELSNGLWANLAAARDGSDGYIDNLLGLRPYNGNRSGDLRGRAIWQPDERVEFDALLSAHRIDDHGGEIYMPVDLASFNALPTLVGLHLGRFDQALDHEGDSHAKSTLAALNGTWHGDAVLLRATASWRSNDARNSSDYDLSPQPWFYMDADYRVRERNVELRAQSIDADARTSWLGGVSVERRDVDFLRIFHTGPGNIWGLPVGAYPRANDALGTDDVALFGESTSRFGAAREWGVAFGMRAEQARNEFDFRGNAIDPQPAHYARADTRLLPKLVLDYRYAPTQQVYFSVARGWLPGGFNTTAFASSNAQYRPERTIAYELGMKGDLAGDTLSYALAAFRNDIHDYQDLVFSATQLESHIVNAPRARTQGIEAQLDWRPIASWQVGASFGNAQAVYVENVLDASNGVRLDGHRLAQVPRFTYDLHAQFERGPWLARADVAGAGAFDVHDYDETALRLQEQRVSGYAIVNVKLGWRGECWSAYVYGRNLGDRRYFTSATFGFATTALYSGAAGTVAPPRTLGIELRRDFVAR